MCTLIENFTYEALLKEVFSMIEDIIFNINLLEA